MTLHKKRSPENAVFKRIYGKSLRVESFWRALVFQEKYLLLCLGRFQECEDTTVGLLFFSSHAFFLHNTIPRLQKSWNKNQPPKGLTMFHKVIRLSIAIIKMKYLVRQWHRIKASGPNSVNRDGFGVSPGVERTDSLHHSTTGLELCPDARQMTHYSSRSDMDVPRSLWPSNRYPGTLVDFDPALKNLSYSSRTLAECWEIMAPRSLHFRDDSELLYNQVHLPPSIILEWEDNCQIILSWGESIYWILNRFLL